MSTWSIDDYDGNVLTEGLRDENEARRVARAMACRRRDSVYIYEVTGDPETDEESGYEEVQP